MFLTYGTELRQRWMPGQKKKINSIFKNDSLEVSTEKDTGSGTCLI